MDGRLRGLMVLMLAGLAVLAAAVANAPLVAGTASISPVSGPPAVGDCLLAGSNEHIVTRADINGIVVTNSSLFGDCAGQHYGEVIAVVISGASSVEAYQRCSGPVLSEFLRAAPGEPFGFAPWRPQLNYALTAAVPGRRQLAAGQDWLACVVSPAGGVAELSTAAVGGYEGSIRHGFGAGRVPGAYGTCTEQLPMKLPTSNTCALPHSTENLAYQRFIGPGPDPAELRRSCSELAAYRLERTDPTVNGELRVQVLVYLSDSVQVVDAVPEGETAQAFCQLTVAGSRTLAGSLLGVGLGRIPWVG